MRKLAILQARMSSTRLPGKVMHQVSGRPMLQYMLARVQKAKLIDGIVLATTVDPSDDILEQLCLKLGLPCFRGSLQDVLDRYYQAAAQFHADVIIRLTADCPLIDPDLIDRTVMLFLGETSSQSLQYSSPSPDHQLPATSILDFTADRLPPPWKRTLPIGLDVEVCSFAALERAWMESTQRYQREHVMPYLYEGVTFPESGSIQKSGWYIERATSSHGFQVALLNHEPDYGTLRWTVDTQEDLEFVRSVAERFEGQTNFGWQDILALLEREPALAAINRDVRHKSAYDVDQHSPDS